MILPLPAAEIQVAFCGIATIAATLGYAYARKAVYSLSSTGKPENNRDVEAGSLGERSLKRKLDSSDCDEQAVDQQERPVKRTKTPPTEHDEDEWEVIAAPPAYEESTAPMQEGPPAPQCSSGQTEISEADTEAVVGLVVVDQVCSEQESTDTKESPEVDEQRDSQFTLSTDKFTVKPQPPLSPSLKSTPLASNAFQTVVSPGSLFESYLKPTGSSLFKPVASTASDIPAWRSTKERSGDATVVSPDSFSPFPNDPSIPLGEGSSPMALSVQTPTKSLNPCVTGEEDETISAEVKGAKLFTKHGRKDFTSGMYGHIKYLASKTSHSKDKADRDEDQIEHEHRINTETRTRLLFRREPLGQVSMNVALSPMVRCLFDEAEGILRVILVQPADMDGSKEDIVVYGLKAGRASKPAFCEFARAVCNSPQLRSVVPVKDDSTTTS